ncbi:metallo-mystery pair system four-Cys motif protein [Salinimonas sediminis]|uniref:Metallo-mystery pair system four-Cys motif protein n=2 Tax=Salinimonas sediminis TaxID=2303538 RepID=A0A346NJ79_9ALTE|nr:metallo-mystery pair system four-Cys motif protein [Salinimonas sediminis]
MLLAADFIIHSALFGKLRWAGGGFKDRLKPYEVLSLGKFHHAIGKAKSMKMRLLLSLLPSLMLLGGCDLLTAKKPPGDIPIRFVDLQKTDDCMYEVELANQRWNVDYLAFYLSEPQVRIEGRWQAVSFVPSKWQSRKLALMQFHDACNSNETNTVIKLDANKKLLDRASAISFTIGLPFSDNHSLSDNSPPPLNNAAMFQSLRAGHSFMRIELQQANEPQALWSFMLASGECHADNEDQAPRRCDKPNRVTLELPLRFNVEDLRLHAKLSQMLFRADMSAGTECNLATPEGSECRKVLSNLTGRDWIRWDAPHQVYLKQN